MGEIVVFGIANCDTVRRARRELGTASLEYRFHDFRRDADRAATLAGEPM
jgi:arsenate reductase-like glutaredoxin family protein